MKKVKIKKRVTWGFNPVSRIVPSKKRFSRSRFRQELGKVKKEEWQ